MVLQDPAGTVLRFMFPKKDVCALKANLILFPAFYSVAYSLQESAKNPRAFLSRDQESETDGLCLDHIQPTSIDIWYVQCATA